MGVRSACGAGRRRSRSILATTALATTALTAIAALSGAAHAQSADQKPAEPPSMPEIVVTGSALPTTLDAIAVPVENVSALKIEQTGVASNALEILRKSIPAFEGRGNTGTSNANNTNQNTGGGSQARLRDLDTLVLINGRRVAPDAIAGVGGKIFVDVNQIPPSAIDHIEVLEDGASAIYGSDAVGGVINFILKHDFDGLDMGGRYGSAAAGYSEGSAYFTAGHKFGDRFDVMLSGSYTHTDPLYQKDRGITSPFYIAGSNVPGTVGTLILNPGLTSPSEVVPTGSAAAAANMAALVPSVYTASNTKAIGATYNLAQFQTLLAQQNIASIGGNFTGRVSDYGHIEVFGDFQYAHSRSDAQFLPSLMTVSVPAGAPYNPTTGAVSAVKFGVAPDPKQYDNISDKFRATIGARGDFVALDRKWRWETGFVHSQDDLKELQGNVIYAPNVPLAIAGGYNANGTPVAGGAYSMVHSNFSTTSPMILVPALDPFARSGWSQATLGALLGSEVINGTSTLDSVDGKVTTEIVPLPAGDIGLAVGGGWRREALSAGADLNGRNTGPTAQRWFNGQFFNPFTKDRTIYSAFTEVRAPITGPKWDIPGLHALDLIGALRFEHYSDAGDSSVPKIGFRWQPFDPQVTIRGTYSKSFTAPSLYAEYGPTDTRIAGGTIIPGIFPSQPSSPFNAEDGNNPNLKPSSAKIYSLGVTIKPNILPDLHFSAQYTEVNQTGIAGGIGFNNIIADVNLKGSQSIFYNNLAKNNFPGQPGAVQFAAPGAVLSYLNANPGVNSQNLYAVDQFRNLGGIRVRTVDLTLGYTFRTEHYGRFDLDSLATYLPSFKYQALPSQPYYQFAGVASNSPYGGGTEPKWRLYTTLGWSLGAWEASIGDTFIDSVIDEGAGGATFVNTHAVALPVKSYNAIDLRVAYTLHTGYWKMKSAKLAIGVNNVGDAMPPYAPNAFTDNHHDVATYSPIGRLVYATFDGHF